MNADAFWAVIGTYNQHTWPLQVALLIVVALSLLLSYTQRIRWAAKCALGIVNLFIGIGFFARYGTEPIQRFFALPLYLLTGRPLLYESWRHRDDPPSRPNGLQALLLLLYLVYPLVSLLLGNTFPRMVTHIMPCPVISLSITVYAGYARKNRLLLALLTIWGLTGVKSVIFQAYEDIILLVCGIYCLILLVNEIRRPTEARCDFTSEKGAGS